MLRGLLGFGKPDRPQPPKGKIEVECPTCGAVQYEPRLVVSTFCKKCGDHLRIEKKRVVGTGVRHDRPEPPLASVSGGGLATDAPAEVKAPAVEAPSPVRSPASGPLTRPTTQPLAARLAAKRVEAASSREGRGGVLGSIIKSAITNDTANELGVKLAEEAMAKAGPTAPAEESPPDEGGFGTMIQRASVKAAAAVPVPAEPPPKLEQFNEPTEADMDLRPRSNLPPPTPAPPPASASTLQKMKDQGFYRQQYFKEAQCFDCGHAFKVGRSARSANCPQCGAWISMEDVEINMNSTQSIKTRGDVIIRKRGHLSTASVQCKDLICQGQLEANVTATGDATFRATGTIIGEIRCHRLIVEKGADVTFVNPIYADQVEIHSKVTGTVFSRGQVLITTYGAVNGDVTARSVSIEPGGELNGAMNIIRGETTLFDPTTKPAA